MPPEGPEAITATATTIPTMSQEQPQPDIESG
eukprot:CAMPEP_0197447572 /NCGR_PEP_ID=MMETSP1175-20131217/13827_1 /TAXON_ID=1003142 /ORGANISM="Triceratium dubium, Strain CCMP147" /LENGTH=31 /DNA_ID= /DNA_START= /DNA_END= /DNA_ORIENTATION=